MNRNDVADEVESLGGEIEEHCQSIAEDVRDGHLADEEKQELYSLLEELEDALLKAEAVTENSDDGFADQADA